MACENSLCFTSGFKNSPLGVEIGDKDHENLACLAFEHWRLQGLLEHLS